MMDTGLEYVESGAFKRRPRDFGRIVHGSGSTTLVSMHVNNDQQIIYTMASDFMLRAWKLDQDGKCSESRKIMAAPAVSDKTTYKETFLALARAQSACMDYKREAIGCSDTRHLQCCDLASTKGQKQPQVVVMVDDAGAIQLNNFSSGNMLSRIDT